jgi:sugar (pentulose or hexulose) kinase
MGKLLLCADIGTSSLKTALIDETGNVISYSRQPFLFRYTNHAADEWLTALRSASTELFARQSTSFETIDAICVSGNGPTLVADTGETLSWSVPVEQTGTSLFIPRILAFKKKFRMAWAYSKHIFSGPEYLIWQLTGNCVTILPEKRFASAYWNKEALIESGLTEEEIEKFPPFVPPCTMAGTLTAQVAALLSSAIPTISTKVPVYCGAPDFIAALVGTNTLHSGALCDRAGSSEGINLCTDSPVTGKDIRTLPSVIPGLWNASYLIPDSGTRFAAFKQKIERERGKTIKYSEFVAELIAAQTSADSDPSIAQGKTLMENIAAEVKQGVDILTNAAMGPGAPVPHEMAVTGGQAANDAWNQFKCNSVGIKVTLPSCNDAELLGDAVFALTGMGEYKSILDAAAALCKTAKVFIPQK